MEKPRVIFADDEELAHVNMKVLLEKSYGQDLAFSPEFHFNPQMALNSIKKNPFNVAAVFLDEQIWLNKEEKISGSAYIPAIREINSYIKIIMVSGDESRDALAKWISDGADHYLYKDRERDSEKLPIFINDAVEKFNQKFGGFLQSRQANRFHVPEPLRKIGMVSTSPKMAAVAESVLKIASKSSLDIAVMIVGETGTGKELIAEAFHKHSSRGHKTFRVIDCTQFKDSDTIGVELFGSEAGAYTGAVSKVGLLESANGGTVFVDELHHLGPKAQGMLLRFLQDKTVRRIGGKAEVKVDVRLIFAAQPRIETMIENGEFLPDLAFRIRDFEVKLPPLRDRDNDIEVLAHHFLDQIAKKEGVEKRFHPDAIDLLRRHSWPGNVRAIKTTVMRAWLNSEDAVILPQNLELKVETANDGFNPGAVTISRLRREHKAEMIELILKTHHAAELNTSETARMLGIARSSLRELAENLGIKDLMNSEDKANRKFDKTHYKQKIESYLKMVFAAMGGEV